MRESEAPIGSPARSPAELHPASSKVAPARRAELSACSTRACTHSETAPITRAVNEGVRAAFVLAYLIVRGFYFPYVVWGRYVPDMLELLALPAAQRKGLSASQLWTPFFLGSAFSFLQLYWGYLLVRQLQKMLAGPKSKAADKKR